MTKKVNYSLPALYLFGKVAGMDMKTYLRQATPAERQTLAIAVSSSVAYFYSIAGHHKRPGTKLCLALVAAEPKLTLAELRPDVWSRVATVD
jgi:hypothetical protein